MRTDINGMSFGYGDIDILKDIWLRMGGPQLISVLGPNGVGKSTLINCICHILAPQKGVVYIDGEDVAKTNVKKLAKKLAYVPYSSSDSFPLSVVDAILMGRNPHSGFKTTNEDLRVVYNVLKRLDIEDLALRSFNELSAGQHQKVVLARGLVQEPRILLLDEPTANLDIKHQMDVSALLKDLSREQEMTVVMICHDINVAARYSDKIILMYQGGIYAVGSPEEVITSENILTVYGVESTVIEANGRPHVILNETVKENTEQSWVSPYNEANIADVDIPNGELHE